MRALLFLASAIVAVTVHEYAHAAAALHVGDRTAWLFGRVSLNPVRHVHLVWSVALPLATAFATSGAWVLASGRPVPLARGLRRRERLLVFGAGIGANLVLALLAYGAGAAPLVRVNLAMAVTNLVPLPGLDGWHLMQAFWSPR